MTELIAVSSWTESDRDRAKIRIDYRLSSLNTTANTDVLVEAIHTALPSEWGDTVPTSAEKLVEKDELRGELRGKKAVLKKTVKKRVKCFRAFFSLFLNYFLDSKMRGLGGAVLI